MKKTRTPKTSAHYVNCKELFDEIMISKGQGKPTHQLIKMFYKIANRLSTRFSYKNQDDKIDVIQGGVVDALKYYDRFNPEKSSNAFAYVTQIIKNGFAKTWKILHPIPQSDCIQLGNVYTL